jgi:hypothetical protein
MIGTTWRLLRALVVLALALVLLALPVRAVWVNLDSDGDGLSNCRERAGVRTSDGAATYVTDANNADTDGDLVPDAVEIGPRSEVDSGFGALRVLWDCESLTYEAVSDPSRADADFDGLSDAVELSDGSDVFARDTDDDGLLDAAERRWGSDPNAADTDGDGIRDVEDVTDGLMPVVADDPPDREAWLDEYAEGLFYGEVRESDTVAQLLGSLSSGSSSSIPFVGWVTGTVADVRDIVANSARGEWSEAGMSGTGLVPYVGDAAKVASLTSKFVVRNPKLVGSLARQLATWDKIPESLRTKLVRATDQENYHSLVRAKMSDERIVALVERGATLASIAKLLSSTAGIVSMGPALDPDDGGFLLSPSGAQAALRTYAVAKGGDASAGPVYISLPEGGAGSGRLVDACSYCEAGSGPGRSMLYIAKLGSQVWSETIQGQIDKDAELEVRGHQVEWHFFAGPTGLDVDSAILDALSDAHVEYVVHLPA